MENVINFVSTNTTWNDVKSFVEGHDIGTVLSKIAKNIFSTQAETGSSLQSASWADLGSLGGICLHNGLIALWVRTSFSKNIQGNLWKNAGIVGKTRRLAQFLGSSSLAISTKAVSNPAMAKYVLGTSIIAVKSLWAKSLPLMQSLQNTWQSTSTEQLATVGLCLITTYLAVRHIRNSYRNNFTYPKIEKNWTGYKPLGDQYRHDFLGRVGRTARFGVSSISAIAMTTAFLGYNAAAMGML